MTTESDRTGGAAERYVPFLELLEIEPVQAEKGKAVFQTHVQEKHLRSLGLLHGGAAAALLDSAMGFAALTLAPAGHIVVTVQLNINFVRPAWKGETLKATATVEHHGRKTAVTRGEIRTADGALVALGSATMMFITEPTAER